MVKNTLANAGDIKKRCRFYLWVGRSPGRGHGNALVSLPGETLGQRSLAGYGP